MPDRASPLFLFLAAMLLSSVPAHGAASVEPKPVDGHYADIGDIRMHYEIQGEGEAVVLIHGILGTHARWQPYVDRLGNEFTIITPDSRGRGRTSDGAGPISYGRMAADMIGLIDDLGIERAHFVGHSEGGGIILHLLVDYPDRVQSAVLLGTFYHVQNKPKERTQLIANVMRKQIDDEVLIEGDAQVILEGPFGEFKKTYEQQSPDPSRWSITMRKLLDSFMTQPTFTLDVLRIIERPVLVVNAGRDELIPPTVFDELASSIPAAEMIVFPEGTHMVLLEEVDRIAEAIREFMRKN